MRFFICISHERHNPRAGQQLWSTQKHCYSSPPLGDFWIVSFLFSPLRRRLSKYFPTSLSSLMPKSSGFQPLPKFSATCQSMIDWSAAIVSANRGKKTWHWHWRTLADVSTCFRLSVVWRSVDSPFGSQNKFLAYLKCLLLVETAAFLVGSCQK